MRTDMWIHCFTQQQTNASTLYTDALIKHVLPNQFNRACYCRGCYVLAKLTLCMFAPSICQRYLENNRSSKAFRWLSLPASSCIKTSGQATHKKRFEEAELCLMDTATWICIQKHYMYDITFESLFYLTTPLEHTDFHIISYWKSSIWSLWHISLEETCCCHIGYSFR